MKIKLRIDKFKAFYNINENVKLKFIDYLEWHDIINK